MDFVAEPTLEDTANYQARLPGEPVQNREGGGEPPLRAGARPSPSDLKSKRKSGLLSGAAIIALVVIAGGGFLISPFNNVVPVPPSMKLAGLELFHGYPNHPKEAVATPSNNIVSTAANTHSATVATHPARPAPAPTLALTHPDVLAPSATLASAKPPSPPSPVIQPAFPPTSSQDEVAELEGLQSSATALSAPANPVPAKPELTTAAKPSIAGSFPHPVEAQKPAEVAAQAYAPPAGYVPHEPGAAPQTAAPSAPSPAQAGKPPAPAHTTIVAPAMAKVPPASALQTHPAPPIVQQVYVGPGEALSAVPKLQAAPLSDTQQIQVLELVTQLATLIRDERTQISNLQADEQSGNKATAAKLSDFERRLALVEADQALASASNIPASAPQSAISQPASSTSVALASAKAALSAAGQEASTQPGTPTAPPAPVQPVTPEQYHVQAASPGLAMLAEVDHSGGDGSEIEVQVGDTIPGYGHVLSVSQQGTNWVVKTDSGLIQ
jgi:hypothetical protein